MSFQAMNWAINQTVGNALAKAVLMALANCADDVGFCFPGQERLAKDTEQGERTVRRHLDKLEAAGLISRTHRYDQNGKRTSDSCQLSLPATMAANPDTTGQPRHDYRPTATALPAKLAAIYIDEPSVEPSEEPSVSSGSGSKNGNGAKSDTDKLQHNYNLVAQDLELPVCRKLTADRRRRAGLILKEFGLPTWNEGMKNLYDLPFCCGSNDRGWKAGIDWLLKPANFVKVLEKVYTQKEAA
jgi:hypothetical protein